MRLSKSTVSAAASLAALGLALSLSAAAQAQQPRRVVRAEGPNTERVTIVDETGRVRTRITVRPRSYLDPGKETQPFAQHYHDYAIQPNSARASTETNANDFRHSLDAPGIIGTWPGIQAGGVLGR